MTDPLPDEMGVWSDDNENVWLPVQHYPKRIDAIRWAMDQWAVSLPEVRCRVRWMKYAPYIARNPDGSEAWRDDLWSECQEDEAGAFKVWRLEAA